MFDAIAADAGSLTIEEMYTRYGFEVDTTSIARLCAEHGLTFGNG